MRVDFCPSVARSVYSDASGVIAMELRILCWNRKPTICYTALWVTIMVESFYFQNTFILHWTVWEQMLCSVNQWYWCMCMKVVELYKQTFKSIFTYTFFKNGQIACTVEPLTNDHPHLRPSLSYDHNSCDEQWFLFVYESLTSDHPSYTTTPMWF